MKIEFLSNSVSNYAFVAEALCHLLHTTQRHFIIYRMVNKESKKTFRFLRIICNFLSFFGQITAVIAYPMIQLIVYKNTIDWSIIGVWYCYTCSVSTRSNINICYTCSVPTQFNINIYYTCSVSTRSNINMYYTCSVSTQANIASFNCSIPCQSNSNV